MNVNINKTVQNLEDANCNSDLISKFLEYEKENQTAEQLKLLTNHRKILLDSLHKNQKQIDCLDYLIFNIKQNFQKEK